MGKIAYFHSYVDFWRENSKDFHIYQYQKLKKKLHFSNCLIRILTLKKNVKIICFNFLIFILGAKIQTHFLKKKMKIWLLLWQLIIFQIDIEIQLQFLGTLRNVYLAR